MASIQTEEDSRNVIIKYNQVFKTGRYNPVSPKPFLEQHVITH